MAAERPAQGALAEPDAEEIEERFAEMQFQGPVVHAQQGQEAEAVEQGIGHDVVIGLGAAGDVDAAVDALAEGDPGPDSGRHGIARRGAGAGDGAAHP